MVLFLKNNLNDDIQNIYIIDLTGKIVLNLKSNLSQINVQNLEKGIYILSIKSENKIYNYKIVKN